MLGVSAKGDLLTPEEGGRVLPRMACQRSSAQKGQGQGPAVVPRFETCEKRVKKTRFHPPLTVYFFCFINAHFVALFS